MFISKGSQKKALFMCSVIAITIYLLISSTILVTKNGDSSLQLDNSLKNNAFSIIQITDTQILSMQNSWKNLTKWISSQKSNYNIKMVVHTGDIVNDGGDVKQWENANKSMSILTENGIPYCWSVGNHDIIKSTQGACIGKEYKSFNTTTMQSKSYWLSDFDGKNTAVNFTFGNYSFVIINLEFLANSTVIAWMQNIIEAHEKSNVIIATHSYLNSSGGYGWHGYGNGWELKFKSILDGYSNVFLTLSGHDIDGTAYHSRIGNREEIFFNRQGINACCARLLTFNMENHSISVQTYLAYSGDWLNDSDNKFSFDAVLR